MKTLSVGRARDFFIVLLTAATALFCAVVFFAYVGGFGAFGGVGLLLGPLVVTLFLSLTRMYQRDFAPRSPDNSGAAGRMLAVDVLNKDGGQ